MYYLTECLITRDEPQYLPEHLHKGIQAGVEHFYIYDNQSQTPTSEYLKNYPEFLGKCTIEVFHTTMNSQLDCYAKFVQDHRQETKWCIFIDTDEMIEGDLTRLCKENENFLSLRIHQILHGANGQAFNDPTKTLSERFGGHILSLKRMVKICVQMEYLEKQYPHHAYLNNKALAVQKYNWLKDIYQDNQCTLHHYFYRSFEEWLQKILRGNVNSRLGPYVEEFLWENSIPDADRDYLLKKYGLTLNSRMTYNAN